MLILRQKLDVNFIYFCYLLIIIFYCVLFDFKLAGVIQKLFKT